MLKFNKPLLIVSFICLIISFWNRNDFPQDISFHSELENEPQQLRTSKQAFSVDYKGTSYQIEPEYEYDLFGMVVSYKHHDGKSRLHEMLNDHLNMMDLCVVWSDTAFSGQLNELDFWSGHFTCNVETRNMQAWSHFKPEQLSNNHLLSNDEFIRDRVRDVSIGDQIHVKGWLSSYKAEGGHRRGTSTVRSDSGNGACETIFVSEFDIIQAVNSGWRKLMYTSLILLLFSLFVHFKSPYRPYQ